MATFNPAVAKVEIEPRELVAWDSVTMTARALLPEAFKELDAAAIDRFQFWERSSRRAMFGRRPSGLLWGVSMTWSTGAWQLRSKPS